MTPATSGVLLGLWCAETVLLGAGGVAKLAKPANSAKALAKVGVPRARVVVIAIAGVETALGFGSYLAPPALSAWAVAASYVGFAAFVAFAVWKQLPLSTCGCFGEPDTPPTLTHALVAAAGGAVAVGVALDKPPSVISYLAHTSAPEAVGWVAVVGGITYLAFLSMGALARLGAARSLLKGGGAP